MRSVHSMRATRDTLSVLYKPIGARAGEHHTSAEPRRALLFFQRTTAEACVKRMELEAVAFGEAASDLRAKVPGPVSARPHASVKSAEPCWGTLHW